MDRPQTIHANDDELNTDEAIVAFAEKGIAELELMLANETSSEEIEELALAA